MNPVSQLECDKLRLLFEPPILCQTKKEAKKERRRMHKIAKKQKRARWLQRKFSQKG